MAAWDGVISTVPLTILPPDPRAPSLASVTVQDFVSPTVLPPSLVSGSCCLRLNVRLGLPPQTGGTFTVTLTSSNQAALPLPSIVTQFLGAGGAFGLPSFDIGCCSVATAIRPGVVTAPTPVTITVSLNGSTVSTTVTVLPPSPPRTLTVTQASLNAGQVQVGGQGATPNAALTVNGLGLGGADAAGVFSIRFSPFFSASCKVTVSDGVSSAQATLTGCTPFPLGKPSFFQLAHSGVAGTALPYQAGGVGSEFVAFRYDWGDGTTLRDPATGFHPVDAATAAVAGDPVTHTFGTSGTFTVTVTALDPAGGSVQSDPAPVTIAPAPGTIAPPPPPPPTAPASIVQLTLTATGRAGESISSTPAGLAVNVGTTASASFATGTSVTLTVSNGRTAIWSGGCSSGGAKTKSCSFTINAATSVTANVQ